MEEEQLTMPSKTVSDDTSSSEFQEVIIPEPLRQMKLEASDMSSQCGENAASYSTSPSEISEADAGDDVLPPQKRPIECQVDRSYLFEGQHDSTYSTVTSATQLKGMDADSTSNLLPTFKLYDAAAKNRILPERPGHLDSPYYLKHGTCGYAENCRFNHPKQVNSTASLPVVKEQDGQTRAPFRTEQSAAMVQSDFNLPNIQISNLAVDHASPKKDSFPERQGQPDCQFFLKTGGCAFGEECIFNHPKVTKKQTSPCLLNEKGLPLRPGKTVCKFYSQHGSCRFGLNCLFDHPEAS